MIVSHVMKLLMNLASNLFQVPCIPVLGAELLASGGVLPGEGYQDYERNLRLLTRDCEGEYQLARFEESLVYSDGGEGTEDRLKRRISDLIILTPLWVTL